MRREAEDAAERARDAHRTASDRDLGMHRAISRRDFLGGMSIAIAGSVVPGSGRAEEPGSPAAPAASPATNRRALTAFPPARTGMRGNHAGSFEVAHQLAFEGRSDWGPTEEPDAADYDLVVVGAGASGLAAAHFYRKQRPDSRILILDNHDDFGGHAKRNEFRIGDRMILGYGGSQSMESPGDYSAVSKALLADLAVDVERFYEYYDRDFYSRHGLGSGVFFDRATYGVDRLVVGNLMPGESFLGLAESSISPAEMVAAMPIGENARRELSDFLTTTDDRLPDHSIFREPGYLRTISYLDFLTKHAGVRDPQAIGVLQDVSAGY